MRTPPTLPPYEEWQQTCDTLHALTQLLGKVAVALAPPEPQLQHAALRLSARGWETLPLPAPDGSGSFSVTLDLRSHEAVIEHSAGHTERSSLAGERPVGEIVREVLGAIGGLVGPVQIDHTPQEVPWTVPLDEDEEHRRYDAAEVTRYLAAATEAALALAEFRAPYRGRSSPVNAWWGSFDLAVVLFSGESAEPPSSDFIMRNAMDAQEVEIGWWPGDARYGKAALYAYAHPAPEGFASATLTQGARWEAGLGEYVLDWDDACAGGDPRGATIEFARAAFLHACQVCGWDPQLAGSAQGTPPPVS